MLLKVAPDQPQGSETAAEEAPLTAYPALEGSQSLLSTTPMKAKTPTLARAQLSKLKHQNIPVPEKINRKNL